ncbi:alpha/beta fold hydrolase [Sphingomonas ginkgonis]|uniref:Alpha/beta fold hydrolase n=1 Tax=Sphingomonas ginkgonis TaxID=2315330 RepID=A0A429V947_9SPHN|nr:alpha/beta fold hydrolase [Sphingomonas ginkgonis]RST30469.1 alpha/beta fold hydrolase [Sphingomonas ginkgonis]
MDVLGDVLGSLRLTGGVILEGHGRGRWCVSSQLLPEDVSALFPGGGPMVAYHYVDRGQLWAECDGHRPVTAGEGSVILCPRNHRHRLFTDPAQPARDSHEFVSLTEGSLARFAVGEGEESAAFYCGFLGVEADHPLLDCLPPLMVVSSRDGQSGDWLRSNLRFLSETRPPPEMVSRIAELLFADAVRNYVGALPKGAQGWLAGLRDPAVARALAIIHARFADELDIELLARESGVSRSVLGERFVSLLGEPPMRYCSRWRMRVAAKLLREGRENSASIAYSVGFQSEAAFTRAFKREYGEPPATWKKRHEERERAVSAAQRPAALPEQQVRYCHAHDGTRLAWSRVGKGPPLVKTANWLNHIEQDFASPLWRHWLHELTAGHALVRYDERANGLSDWDTPEISFEAFVDDLESVVDCARLERFDLLGISQGAAVAVAFAVRHPEQVRRMVLCGGYAQGWKKRAQPEEVARREAMLTLTELGWGAENPAYRQLFTSLYIPDATLAQQHWFTDVQKWSASAENAVRLQRVLSEIDVAELLPAVRVPTLVLHARHDQVVPYSCGEQLARSIPGSTFVPLDSGNHILLADEPAWKLFVRETRAFLAD